MLQTEGKVGGRNRAYTPVRFATESLLFIVGRSDSLNGVTMNVGGLTGENCELLFFRAGS